jgi:hypothetical protein
MTSLPRILEWSLVTFAVGCSSQTLQTPVDAAADSTGTIGGDAGGSDGADGAGPSEEDCGTLAWAGDACAACTTARCCSVQALCAAIPECGPLALCWEGCGGDAGCTTACGDQYIPAISNYNAVLNCQANSCPAQCGP